MKALKQWMNSRRYSPEDAFNRLLKAAKISGALIDRHSFHKGLLSNGVSMTSVEIDWLFNHVTGSGHGNDRPLNIKLWQARIIDETDCLQAIRKAAAGYDKSTILKRLEIKLWDADLSMEQLKTILRRLDEQISEDVVDRVFKRLQSK